ncbi:MAG: hypothetical protein WAK48_03815 [Candidatus Acidiferrum sp.]|jgi:hypothetical protein
MTAERSWKLFTLSKQSPERALLSSFSIMIVNQVVKSATRPAGVARCQLSLHFVVLMATDGNL